MDRSSSVCAKVSTGVVGTSIGRITIACGKFSIGIVGTSLGRSPPVCGRVLTDVVGTFIGRTMSVRSVYGFYKAAFYGQASLPILLKECVKILTLFSLQRKAYSCLWTSLILEELSARIARHRLTD
jgi:hypothetical protein